MKNSPFNQQLAEKLKDGIMKKKQKEFLWIGITLIALIVLYPRTYDAGYEFLITTVVIIALITAVFIITFKDKK